MSTRSRAQAEQALAALINALRPDWPTPSVLAIIRKQPTAPLDRLAAAAIYATTRRDQLTPHLIADDAGDALDRLTGKLAGPPTPQPTRGCPAHRGQPADCPECAAYRRSALTGDDMHAAVAAAKQAIRDGREGQA